MKVDKSYIVDEDDETLKRNEKLFLQEKPLDTSLQFMPRLKAKIKNLLIRESLISYSFCKYCQKQFQISKNNKRYCSKNCKKKGYPIMRRKSSYSYYWRTRK